MISIKKIGVLGVLCFLSIALCFAQKTNSVLSQGIWYKFSVTNDGVVKIDYNLLKSSGVNPDQIDPRNIKIFAGQQGMLPQAINKPRVVELTQIAIQVTGEADGKFNTGDQILFFGQGPDKYHYNIQRKVFDYENNLYSDKNFYFLTVGSEPGLRIANSENIAGSFPIIAEYEDLGYYETEKYNILKSGRHWFGEQFDASKEATIRFDVSGVVENSEIRMISHVMAQSIEVSSFQVSFNNNPVLTQPISQIPNTRYGIKGVVRADTITFNSNTVGAIGRDNQDIKYQFTKGSVGLSVGYLDFVSFAIKRKLAQYGDQTIFRSASSLSNAVSTFEITLSKPNSIVWDVTDPFSALNQQATPATDKIRFSANTEALKTFTVFHSANLKSPIFEEVVPNQNLYATIAPELLIITHPNFQTEAQRLANFKQTKSGISTTVVTINQIYNEYSGGKQDVTALRDFIRDLYIQPNSQLKNVLLFGRGSYDYKNRVLGNTNYVPIYESRNSLSPLETYGSDDYLTFLEPGEGEWTESPAQYHTMDVGIGRLPIKKLEEAKIIVDKLIDYQINPAAFGAWQNEIMFVADDGDFNIHNSQADQLANSIELLNSNYSTRKFFLDSFDQITKPSGQSSPSASKALDLAVKKGALIINFTGHGSERVWMDERILDETVIQTWKNAPRYPLFVTATCEFGRHDDPFQITSGELTVLQKKGGSIGLVSSTRPVNSSTNFTLNKAFYESLFTKENNKYRSLGVVFRNTKNNSISGVANRNFSLLGDPSMVLALADNEIVFDEIKTSAGSLELKGLSTVLVSGHIEKEAVPQTNFTGELSLTLFDKVENQTTKGDQNSPFNYSERSNMLFRGKSSVSQGAFNMQFIMPINISQDLFTGKFSAFASTKTGILASGNSLNNMIGDVESNPNGDTTPPSVQLFMGDTTFIAGGIVGPSTRIVARLYDESGVNISSVPTGNELTATIDDEETIILNDYYSADINTYKKGWVDFPLDGLQKGKHALTLSASDTYNNRKITRVDFIVTDGVQIQVEEFSNYPNPFSESTTLEFTHTRPGEDLEAFITIYDLTGNLILKKTYEITTSQYRVTLGEWDGKSANGTKLGSGVYVGKVSIRSLLDGSKNEQFTKLIILN
ncbi:MAG: type IX secretion system sortase PorU [Cyclobacteriaceae bacterium]|nr:type IX secretion system sortase PorU [Cyclobacteriaceae bacterium]